MNLALVYLKLNNNNSAIYHCERTLEMSPNNCKALYRMALAYTNKAEYEKAEVFLNRVMAIEPPNEDIRGLKELLEKEKKEYLKQYTEISRKVFTNINRNVSGNNNLSPLENALINFIVICISISANIGIALVKLSYCVLCGCLKGAANYAMSFWFVQIPVCILIILPWKILTGILSWALEKLKQAADQQSNNQNNQQH